MPIATPDVYNEMLDRAKERGYAYPAINCTSSETLNAAIRGYAEAGSDGIVQISTGGPPAPSTGGARPPCDHWSPTLSSSRRSRAAGRCWTTWPSGGPPWPRPPNG